MSIFEIKDSKTVEKLFDGYNETMIYSALEGAMGSIYADSVESPKSAQIVIADFCFFGGLPNHELVKHKPKGRESDFIIMTSNDENWDKLIEECYKEKARKVYRYALKKEKEIFDRAKLNKIVEGLDKEFQIQMINNEELFEQIRENEWSRDFCSQFKDYEDYRTRGIGVVALKEGKALAGASSYTVYNGGIEIEIDTREDFRRRGLALCCGAKLILECLNRGIYPSWDAQNKGSLLLAEKLGYHFDREYVAYEIFGY